MKWMPIIEIGEASESEDPNGSEDRESRNTVVSAGPRARGVGTQSVRVVFCFHSVDLPYVQEFETHLRPLCHQRLVELWHTGMLLPGEPRDALYLAKLAEAHIVLLFASADFNAGWDDQISRALRDSASPQAQIVPIALRSCDWAGMPFFGLQPIPADGLPLVRDGRAIDERFKRATEELRRLVASLRSAESEGAAPMTTARPALVSTLVGLEQELRRASRPEHTPQEDTSEIGAHPTVPPPAVFGVLLQIERERYDLTHGTGPAADTQRPPPPSDEQRLAAALIELRTLLTPFQDMSGKSVANLGTADLVSLAVRVLRRYHADVPAMGSERPAGTGERK
jgi:hypothetical protein